MDDTNQSDKNQKMVLKSIAKWLVIFALIAFVCYKNQDLMQEKAEKEKNHLTYRRRRSQESSLQTEPSWKAMQSSWQLADSLIRVPVPQVTDTASQENWD